DRASLHLHVPQSKRTRWSAVVAQPAGELVVGPVGGDPQPGGELLAVLSGQQPGQRGAEDRPVRPPQRAGDDAGHEVVVARTGRLGDRGGWTQASAGGLAPATGLRGGDGAAAGPGDDG